MATAMLIRELQFYYLYPAFIYSQKNIVFSSNGAAFNKFKTYSFFNNLHQLQYT